MALDCMVAGYTSEGRVALEAASAGALAAAGLINLRPSAVGAPPRLHVLLSMATQWWRRSMHPISSHCFIALSAQALVSMLPSFLTP